MTGARAHINSSIQNADTGENLFGNKDKGFSDMALNAVGGLLRHGAGLSAITCSTVNSYKGLVAKVPGLEGVVYTWGPTHMTHGPDIQSAILRLPQNRYCVENRISANETNRGDIKAALGAIRARSILLPCSDDLYFPPADNEIEVGQMPNAELLPFISPWGHCVASPGNSPEFQGFLDQCIEKLLPK